MRPLRTICVYCGSQPGTDLDFVSATRQFGKILAENKVGLVYGGGSIGLMGELAKSVLHHGGRVTGIIPESLTAHERMLTTAQEVIVTRDLHERKRLMFERADAFVALPGGVGTLEELVEQLTWEQLGHHRKPILIANLKDFWQPLLALMEQMRNSRFIPDHWPVHYLVATSVDDILPKLQAATPSDRVSQHP
jgi:uncharacterized protein (TIGR00730 family)